MGREQWEELGVKRNGASLLTPVSLVEGEILEFMETRSKTTLSEIVAHLSWPVPIIMIGVGGLINQGLLIAMRHDTFILLTRKF